MTKSNRGFQEDFERQDEEGMAAANNLNSLFEKLTEKM